MDKSIVAFLCDTIKNYDIKSSLAECKKSIIMTPKCMISLTNCVVRGANKK